ncbi:MAG: hypothetical protein ACTSPX_03135 [Candidatus Thorarchaeota archaeon]
MLIDELIEDIWRKNWDIIRASKAYKEGYTLKTARPMIELLFKAAMMELYARIKTEGDYVLVPLDVAIRIVWDHVWRVRCNDCKVEYDYDAVGFLHYLDSGMKCDECGSTNTTWEVLLD